ncbi:MAG: TonB-dependent receptor, partial [Bacteroidia bacterium]|nr:TonB-dependent receptor [Bacteroidia bacterium]
MTFLRILFASVLSLGLSNTSLAQSLTHQLQGYVYGGNGEAIPHVKVIHLSTSSLAATNAEGYFSIRCSAGSNRFFLSHVSFQKDTIRVDIKSDTLIEINLTPISLSEITILEDRVDLRPLSQMSVIDLPIELVKSLPALLGEQDIVKTLALMPGVTSGIEGTSSLLVRGGSQDQNLFLLDDVPIYNLSHIFGFVSIINPNVVKSATLYKGGFPAKYGGRLSSILDIQMRNGANDSLQGEVNLGIISSKILVEGPVKKGQSGYLFSARSSYLGLIFLPFRGAFENGDVASYNNYWMGDVNLKLYQNVGKNGQNRLSVNLYGGVDNWTTQSNDNGALSSFKINWGNQLASIKYHHLFHKNWFGKGMIYFSNYTYGLSTEQLVNEVANTAPQKVSYENNSKVSDIGIKYSATGYLGEKLTLEMGIESIAHFFNPILVKSISLESVTEVGETPIQTSENGVFAEVTTKISDHFETKLGLRQSLYHTKGKTYYGIEPRASLGYRLSPQTSLKASYSRMVQYLHSLSNNGIGLPNDIWLPTTDVVPPSLSNQIALGVEQYLPEPAISVSIETYVKHLQRITNYSADANLLNTYSSNWEQNIISDGLGRVYGVEVLVSKSAGFISGWLAYTLSWNNQRFNEINGGNWYPSRFDRRHMFSAVAQAKLSSSWKASATFTYSSGAPIT